MLGIVDLITGKVALREFCSVAQNGLLCMKNPQFCVKGDELNVYPDNHHTSTGGGKVLVKHWLKGSS